jgi:hypothetical protein
MWKEINYRHIIEKAITQQYFMFAFGFGHGKFLDLIDYTSSIGFC